MATGEIEEFMLCYLLDDGGQGASVYVILQIAAVIGFVIDSILLRGSIPAKLISNNQ